ncbi:uncharacterized protein LOC142352014 [Convolutriloba macropyga]|uniref:uncharacterized protein LOC142352014 n=1 Tax=Convolutriloba macropyga TaxID=536237 RepID=UPI003F51F1EB
MRRILIQAIIFLLEATFITSKLEPCPAGFEAWPGMHNTKCYAVINTYYRHFGDAHNACQRKGVHSILFEPYSLEEIQAVWSHLVRSGTKKPIWVGYYQSGHNWNSKSTGESIQIPDVMWGWKEPNGGHEHNVMMKDGILADIRNDYNCLPICEITRKEITSSS